MYGHAINPASLPYQSRILREAIEHQDDPWWREEEDNEENGFYHTVSFTTVEDFIIFGDTLEDYLEDDEDRDHCPPRCPLHTSPTEWGVITTWRPTPRWKAMSSEERAELFALVGDISAAEEPAQPVPEPVAEEPQVDQDEDWEQYFQDTYWSRFGKLEEPPE
jgi:hypothetical protein